MLQIRPARYSDAEAAFDIRFQAIRHQCITVYTSEQVQAWTEVQLTDRYRANVERQYHIAWWGEVAIATGLIDLQSAELGALFVLPAFMGQGVGKSMIQYLERLALEAGLDEIHLDATPNATAFYRRCGYHGEVAGIYTSPSGLQLACTPMRKRLVG
ncbi:MULTISPECIES: GNAT family N-acetyltransferase [Pseudomonas]|uniref:GNAT family N-acetyltransferase n=1 Tax=Pseudomonas quercus TaxID=2722792 RepID=A0ABX0YH60_9PSED|nr:MULTISPECIES: GNAT family N-acetyltransferase [Pseudomonas]MBF7144201.1 GNAT family N-acetyltransferase [Pseudomonas sp. LY10J]NJP02667.1 GNAT family N-acetyltransferase [Pseudomonas quercus]